jgi:hypothetical protein
LATAWRSGWNALRQPLSRLLTFFYFEVFVRVTEKTRSWRYRAVARNAPLCARSYRPGDERAIIRLFYLTFRKAKSLGRWRWEFLDNPYGKANVVVLESDRMGIVGHYGGIVVRFNVDGEVIPVAQIADVMIHPVFRGRVALNLLGRAYIKNSRDNGIRLLYGFNEDVVARSNRRFFGAEVALVSEWVREIPRAQAVVHPGADDPEASAATGFGAEADAVWERIKRSYRCATVRDGEYLNWRYSRRSERTYAVVHATDPSSRRIVALAVLGARKSDGLILELLSDPNDEPAIAALLRASIRHFARAGKRRVRTWLSAHGRLRACARAAGFTPVDCGLYLNLLRLDDSLDVAALREDFYYTLGDYDVH